MAGNLFAIREVHERELSDPVLKLLRREDADWHISFVECIFPKLTDRIKKDDVIEKLEHIVVDMIEYGTMPKRYQDDGVDAGERAAIARELYSTLLLRPESGYGYGWIREDLDQTTKELYVTATSDAVRAIDVLRSMTRAERIFTGAKVNVLKRECIRLREMVNPDREQYIARLEAQRAEIEAELARLGADGDVRAATPGEIREQLSLIEELISPLPGAVRRTAEKERENVLELSKKVGNLDFRSDELISDYVNALEAEFDESEDGESFRRAEGILKEDFFDEGIHEMLEILYATSELGEESRGCARRIGNRNDEVRSEVYNVNDVLALSSNALVRLAKRNQRGRFKDQLREIERLRICFSNWAAESKGQNPEVFGLRLPYGGKKPLALAIEPNLPRTPAPPPPLDSYKQASTDGAAEEFALLLRMGPPKVRETLGKMMHSPVIENGMMDVIASFNALPPQDRLIQDMEGVLTRFGSGGTELSEVWVVFDAYGNEQRRVSARVAIPEVSLAKLLEEVR